MSPPRRLGVTRITSAARFRRRHRSRRTRGGARLIHGRGAIRVVASRYNSVPFPPALKGHRKALVEISKVAPPLQGAVVAGQEWREVAFVHWRVAPATVAPLLPLGVAPDVMDGSSWVGLIAFRLGRARVGPLPPADRWGSFTEVNVRLYGVDAEGRRGVVFRSLEASSLPAVIAARALFSLPYTWARTAQRTRPDGWEYASRRISVRPRHPGPSFRLAIAVDTTQTVHDDLSLFLTSRWGLFQERFGRTQWLPNSHDPWVLHPATVVSLRDELCAAAGLPGVVDAPPDSVLFSPGVDAQFGRGHRLGATEKAPPST